MFPRSLINEFLQRLTNTRKSENTIDSYRIALTQFFGDTGELVITPEYIDERMAALSYLSTNSLKVKLSALSKFLKFVQGKHEIEHMNELMDICSSVKPEQKISEAITKVQLLSLMETIDNLRDKAIVKLLSTSGLRVSELTGLRMTDLKEDHLIARDTKNGKDRLVYLPKSTLEVLQAYIQVYRPQGYLFVPLKGTKPINRNTVEQMMTRLSSKVGFKVHPHVLRRYYATTLAKAKVPARTLQKNLGHSSPSMSISYTDSVMEDQKESAEVFEE